MNKEAASCTYVAALNEKPVIPEYDYEKVSAAIEEIDNKIATIKHALNMSNAAVKVPVCGTVMNIDTILIRMAQLNKRKKILDGMRKQLPQSRVVERSYLSKNAVPEYRYINYDLDLVKKDYKHISDMIMELQMALDKYNQTEQFEVDI